MAKIKVHELAKEIDLTSKDVIAALSELGIEGKTASSGLEEDQAEAVKKKLARKGAQPAVAKAEPAKPEAPKAETAAPNAETAAPKAAPAKSQQAPAGDAPKKKKPIIIVGGKKAPGQGQRPQGQRPQGQSQRPGSPSGRPQQGIIRPSVPTTAERQARYAENNPQEKIPSVSAQVHKENREQPVKDNKEVVQAVNTSAGNSGNRPESNRGTAGSETRVDNRTAVTERRDRPMRDGQVRNDGPRRDNRDGRPNRDNQGRGDFRGQRNDGQNRSGQNGNRSDRPSRPGQGGFNKSGVIINQSKNYNPGASTAPADNRKNDNRRRNDKKKDDRFDNEDGFRGGKPVKGSKPGKFEKPQKKEEVVEEKIKVITLPEMITIKDLADKMKIPSAQIIKKLFLQGQVVTVNEEISYEQAEEIAVEYEILCEKEVVVDVIEELLKEEEED